MPEPVAARIERKMDSPHLLNDRLGRKQYFHDRHFCADLACLMVDAPGSHTARRLAERFRIENLYNHFRRSPIDRGDRTWHHQLRMTRRFNFSAQPGP